MSDTRETDLLAYILSGFVIAISGIAVGVASTNTTVPNSATIPAAVTAPPPKMPIDAQTSTLIPSAVRGGLPASQVWECVVSGHRAFSDAPCGKNPTIRELRQPNTMHATVAMADDHLKISAPRYRE
jgi:hypothetical protein